MRFGVAAKRGRPAEPEAAEARQLQRGLPQVEAGHEAEDVELDPLDPAELHAEHAPQARLHAGAAVGQADERKRGKSLPMAVGGSALESSGTARSTAATNVLLLGPGPRGSRRPWRIGTP